MGARTPYFGLRGDRLHRAIWAISCFAVMIFAFNQASAGNVVNLPTFYTQFPQMNTATTEGSEEAHNATIQGSYHANT